jgi:hypothetical protein
MCITARRMEHVTVRFTTADGLTVTAPLRDEVGTRSRARATS